MDRYYLSRIIEFDVNEREKILASLEESGLLRKLPPKVIENIYKLYNLIQDKSYTLLKATYEEEDEDRFRAMLDYYVAHYVATFEDILFDILDKYDLDYTEIIFNI